MACGRALSDLLYILYEALDFIGFDVVTVAPVTGTSKDVVPAP